MLANEVQIEITIGVRPEPSFGPIKSGAVIAITRQIPEGNRDIFAINPLPIGRILGVPESAQPVLAVGIIPMPSVELPTEKALEGRRGLVDKTSSSHLTKPPGTVEIEGLVVVKYITLSIVSGSTAERLVSE